MKEIISIYCNIIGIIGQLIFCWRHKIILIGYPTHPNLGDQAQYMCIRKWLKNNYNEYKVINVPCQTYFEGISPYFALSLWSLAFSLLFAVLKMTIRRDDIFVGHSGYYLVDHHGGWFKFLRVAKSFKRNKFIIFPQTLNMYNPYFANILRQGFDEHPNITLLCRDEVSYKRATELFHNTKLLLYPDIVTSLIGTTEYEYKREGILFCMRNDVEAFYCKEDIADLRNSFSCKTDLTDTTIDVSISTMKKHREELIYKKIKDFAHYKLVVTDRYHGTIFSQIASTPVIVVSSADHKLCSGVKWFPDELFRGHIYYAKDLNEVRAMAQKVLDNKEIKYIVPDYFRTNYWDVLKNKL